MERCLRKWQVGMLLVLCLMILLPVSAMASSGIYVPVEGTITLESGGKTLKGTIQYSVFRL